MSTNASKEGTVKSVSPEYTVRAATLAATPNADWESPFWSNAEILEIKNFRPESSDHRPRTRARLLYEHKA